MKLRLEDGLAYLTLASELFLSLVLSCDAQWSDELVSPRSYGSTGDMTVFALILSGTLGKRLVKSLTLHC